MDQIIHTFGIDWRLIAIQIFNFVLLGAAMTYFLYHPMLRLIDERKKMVAKGVEDAKNAALSLENAGKEKDGIIAKAVTEASEIVKRGEDMAKRDAASIVHDAHEQSARIVQDGEKKAEAIADAIRKQTEAEVAKTALLAAEKILRERA